MSTLTHLLDKKHELLIILYSDKQADLEPYTQYYTTDQALQSGNVISTTKSTILPVIKAIILDGSISHFEVIYIDLSPKIPVASLFDANGQVKSFFIMY